MSNFKALVLRVSVSLYREIDTNWCPSYVNMISGNIFVNRLVKLWNPLPNDVVSAYICSVSSFKRRLDLSWRGFSLYYDYKSVI